MKKSLFEHVSGAFNTDAIVEGLSTDQQDWIEDNIDEVDAEEGNYELKGSELIIVDGSGRETGDAYTLKELYKMGMPKK